MDTVGKALPSGAAARRRGDAPVRHSAKSSKTTMGLMAFHSLT